MDGRLETMVLSPGMEATGSVARRVLETPTTARPRCLGVPAADAADSLRLLGCGGTRMSLSHRTRAFGQRMDGAPVIYNPGSREKE